MFRNRCVLTSLLFLFMAISNFVNAANQSYIVSFIAGQPGLGLVYVTQIDTEIQVGPASITTMGRAMGSTAVLSLRSGWDGDVYFDVYATHSGDAAKPIETGWFGFDSQLKKYANGYVLAHTPGQYHPLHLFQTPTGKRLLVTGSFGTTGANNYVSYELFGWNRGTKKNIFANPGDRFPGSAAAAPDGGVMSQMTFTGLNHVGVDRKLSNGNLTGTPVQWLNVNSFKGYSQSLSNPIESSQLGTTAPITGTRYLAYRNFRQTGTSNSQSQVVIQNVDAKTGELQGRPRAITNFATAVNVNAEKVQSIAISPDGGMILYTAWNNVCKKQILLARRLAKGSSAGIPVVVVGCRKLEKFPVGVYGINIAPIAPPL